MKLELSNKAPFIWLHTFIKLLFSIRNKLNNSLQIDLNSEIYHLNFVLSQIIPNFEISCSDVLNIALNAHLIYQEKQY
jgi:hypothetical protein